MDENVLLSKFQEILDNTLDKRLKEQGEYFDEKLDTKLKELDSNWDKKLDRKLKELDSNWDKKLDRKFEEYHKKNIKDVTAEIARIVDNVGAVEEDLQRQINELGQKMDKRFDVVETDIKEMKRDLRLTKKMINARLEYDNERIEKLEEKVGIA